MNRKSRFTPILLLATFAFLMVFAGGCATAPPKKAEPTPEEKFESGVASLINDLLALQRHTPGEMAPAAVMSGALKSGGRYPRLEEYVIEALKRRLRQQHEIYSLSRQNWFEYREGRPLSFSNMPFSEKSHLKSLLVYEVTTSADEVLNKMRVSVTATDVDGRTVPGVVAETELDFEPGSPAQKLFGSSPKRIAYPEGLEERPYVSMDRLSFSLSAELADAYKSGVIAGDQKAADVEVQVLLFARPARNIHSGLVRAIQDSLQQEIVKNSGFTCSVSEEDFGPAFRKIDFYKRNKEIFELEESKFKAGTVLLMADISKHQDGDKIGVALRALWRITPLESETGELIPTNVSGTYLSGFTAKAYLLSSAVKIRYPKPRPTRIVTPQKAEKTEAESPPVEKPAPAKTAYLREMPEIDMDVCFYKFTEVYEKRIYPVLNAAPGVTDILKVDELCDKEKSCHCYELVYKGNQETLATYLRENLRTSNVVPFKIKTVGDDRMQVLFHAGFE